MNTKPLRALIVDDEELVRDLTMRALTASGFVCEGAVDGAEGLARLKESNFDLLVTDLRMPVKNGYALALAALELESRPFIVVLTGVAEPRIAQDLLLRGVEDIIFKPISYDVFAAKVKALMTRGLPRPAPAASVDAERKPPAQRKVTLVELGKKISEVSQIFPISQAALDVFNVTATGGGDAEQITELIENDAALSAQILKIVNSAHYNRTGRGISSIKTAVIRVGQRQIGELALAHHALTAMAISHLPWLDIQMSWKRSLAAGVAMEQLVAAGNHDAIQSGLHNAAIMHPLGRVVLGTLFPEEYQWMIDQCVQTHEGLRTRELTLFPVSHGHVLANVLQSWGVPTRATRPLTYLHTSYADIKELVEPERTRALLLKVSVYFARLAVGRWEPWETVEIPPAGVLRELGVTEPSALVDIVSQSLDTLCKSGIAPASISRATTQTQPDDVRRQTAFYDVVGDPLSTLPLLLARMGWQIEWASDAASWPDRSLVLNGTGATGPGLPRWVKEIASERRVIVTDAPHAYDDELGRVVVLPASVHQLEQGLMTSSLEAEAVPS